MHLFGISSLQDTRLENSVLISLWAWPHVSTSHHWILHPILSQDLDAHSLEEKSFHSGSISKAWKGGSIQSRNVFKLDIFADYKMQTSLPLPERSKCERKKMFPLKIKNINSLQTYRSQNLSNNIFIFTSLPYFITNTSFLIKYWYSNIIFYVFNFVIVFANNSIKTYQALM